MTAVAENAPELVHDAVADVRKTLITIIDKVNQSTAAMMLAFHDERVDLTADVQAERAKALVALTSSARRSPSTLPGSAINCDNGGSSSGGWPFRWFCCWFYSPWWFGSALRSGLFRGSRRRRRPA